MIRDRAGAILAEAGLPPEPEPPAVLYELPDFDLGALAAEGVKPPVMLAGGMLYASAVHCVAGQPGGGKTTLACWWMLRHVRDGGNVMLLDEESGPELAAEKFLDLGASADELRPPRFSYCPFPARGWNTGDLMQLRDRVTERRPGIIMWDSGAAFLAIAGQDENSAMDITRFWGRVLVPLARQHGAAVIVIDHTGRNADHGGYGRGSGAKKAASDVQFIIETVKPFNRAQDGVLRLTTAPGKDRRGYLSAAYCVRVRTGGSIALDITEDDTESSAAAGPDMPPARAKLLEALREIASPDRPATVAELVDRIAAKHGHGLKRPTCSTQLNALQDAGLADAIDEGRGRPKLWFPTCQQTGADGSDLRKHDFHDPPENQGCQQGVSAGAHNRRSDPSAHDDTSAMTPPGGVSSASAPLKGGADDADTLGGGQADRWLARRDPGAPEVRPPCEHPECWDALAGRCITGGWPADSPGSEAWQ